AFTSDFSYVLLLPILLGWQLTMPAPLQKRISWVEPIVISKDIAGIFHPWMRLKFALSEHLNLGLEVGARKAVCSQLDH
ncbi:MAG: hypothetical protein WKG07_33340, partial [Hymenobacter sp.]